MMAKWLDLAAQLQAGAEHHDVSDVSDNSPPNVTNVANVTGSAPPAVASGLKRLAAMAAPRVTRPEVWPEVVADALRLVSEGWAGQALALGWTPLHLWGCSPCRRGNPAHDGLAVWLAGRRPLLLDATSCIVADGPQARSIFNRRPVEGAVFLWDLGSRGNGR